MSPRTKYLLKRLAFIPVAVFVVVSVAFAIVNLMPGDPAHVVAGGLATDEQVDEVRRELGLAEPLGDRYASYLADLGRGDLGTSFYTKRSVASEIWAHLPNSIELVLVSMLLAGVIGLVLGGAAAYFQGRPLDRFARVGITALQSVPDFLLGLVLIYVVFFLLGWAPAPVGRIGLFDTAPPTVTGFLLVDTIISGDMNLLGSVLHHMMLPVITLGLAYAAYFAKTTRAVMGAEMNADQIEFARACGLPERTVFLYAWRAARTPILTYAAILVASLVGGLAIIEIVFSWQGIGQWAVEAILKLDIPSIQGFILVIALLTMVVYLLLDIVVAMLDPRVTYG